MTNAEMVAALRWCQKHGCSKCVALLDNGSCKYGGAIKILDAAADALEAAEKRIAELMPKEGEWIDMGDFAMCSVCKRAQRKKYRQYNDGFMWVRDDFCPKCGARCKQ